MTTATTFARRCCSSTSTCNRPCHSDNMCSNHIRLRRCSCLFDVDNDTSASTFLTSFDGAPRIARVGGFSAAVVFGLVVVLFCTVPALALSDWPPAPNSGGASCNINAEVSCFCLFSYITFYKYIMSKWNLFYKFKSS